jgi:phosphoglycolate phosphatase
MFDLDGTLTDPHDGITRCVSRAFEQLGRPVPSSEELRGFIGPPLQDTFAQWLCGGEVDDAVRLYRERFDAVGWRENRVYDEIPSVLSDLSGRGHSMLVATSKPVVFAERIIEHFELSKFFDGVLGATLDGSLRHKSDLIAKALVDTSTPAAEAVMIGDRAQDIVGAKVNGVRAIGVRWGYAEAGELEAAAADAIAATPDDLRAVIPA